jgi:hypothetical protein
MRLCGHVWRLAGLLLVTGCAAGGPSPQPGVPSPATTLLSASAANPRCFDEPYAAVKVGYNSRQEIQADPGAETAAGTSANGGAPFQRVYVQAHPLGDPPEISRIQRGVVSNFVGLFINDGLVHWDGVDLDRMEMVSVARRIYDKRASFSRPFGDPEFLDFDKSTIVRTWSDDQRIEMEVVSRSSLTPQQIQAFVCVANAVWRQPPRDLRSMPMMTDAAPGSNVLHLFDRAHDRGRTYLYEKDEFRSSPLDVVINAINRQMKYEWPLRLGNDTK